MKLATIGDGIGKGLLAGLAGTAAMTASSTIEAKIRGRAFSAASANATAKLLGIKEFVDDGAKARLSNLVHRGYAARGVLRAFGLSAAPSTPVHFLSIRGSTLVMLPTLDVAPPVWAIGQERDRHRRLPSLRLRRCRGARLRGAGLTRPRLVASDR